MPYDHEHHGGGGGDDPRHKGIEEVAAATLDALGILAKSKGLCLDCMALQMSGSSLALFALQQDAIDHKTGKVDPDKLQLVIQAVTDVAMKYAAQTVAGYKARKG
jgi:hypothetical protein